MLSRDYNSALFWFRAKRDLGDINAPEWEKFDLINRAISAITGQFYDLMSISYMTDAVINYSTGGKYDAGTNGTYTVLTKTVTLNSPSENLTNADVEKLVVFRIGTVNYVGKVLSVTTTSSFVFDGDIFPTGTAIVNNSLSICDTTVQNDTVSLSALRIMRTGSNIKIELSTTATATIKPVSQRQLDTFDTGGANNKTIVWCISGDNLNFKKGADLVSYGTMTIHYPRVPYLVAADTDMIDLPDGTAMEIALIYLRSLIQRRFGLPQDNNEALMQTLINNLYRTFGAEVDAEVVKSKTLALK